MSRTFCLAVVSLVVVTSALAEASPVLCARRDRQTGEWKEGSNVRIRSACVESEVEVQSLPDDEQLKHVVDANGTQSELSAETRTCRNR